MNVQQRQEIERQIVTQVIMTACELGHQVSIENGASDPTKPTSLLGDLLPEIMQTDEEWLVISHHGKPIGQVFMVYGNDGWDVISDYSDNDAMESLLQPAFALSDKLAAAN